MRILLLHLEDTPLTGPWIGQPWDLVFDLARSGAPAYERWSRVFGCPARPVDEVRDGQAEIRKVGELLKLGLGHLVDNEGLDWWELTAILFRFQLETLVVLRKWADRLPPDAEVWITRSGFEADALRLWLGARLHVLSSHAARPRKGLRHYYERWRQLPASSVLQVLKDKYDTGYRLRRHFHSRPPRNLHSVVLAPSSYVNMSRTVGGILQRWEGLRKRLESIPELAAMLRLGLMDDYPRRFADGLAIRDAWIGVLDHEPVEAVLCCDDSNPATHLPMLLGRKRGLPAISCHHGAFDGRYLIKTCHADVLLAKGEMELDYLVNTCRVDPSLLEIGAPAAPPPDNREGSSEGDWIVFFSEPYEVMAERTEEIYRDILPGLADLARRTGKTLKVKLHPSENLKERQRLVATTLSGDQSRSIQWLTGNMEPELLRRMYFGVTVQSSVVVECLIHGVPCFLCEWLDLWPYGYMGQFRKFGVGMVGRQRAQ